MTKQKKTKADEAVGAEESSDLESRKDLGKKESHPGEYEIPEETVKIEKLIGELEEEQASGKASAKKAGSRKKSRKRSHLEEEFLARMQEKNKMLFELQKKNSDMEAELKSVKDKWLRAVAEFENYRKRSRKEWELQQQKAKADVVIEILSVVHDFERAFSAAKGKNDEFVQGIQLIYQKLKQTLEKFGVEPIDALHNRFDPRFHMAIGQVESDEESGHVVEVTEKGYLLNGTVLRPAKVIIAK